MSNTRLFCYATCWLSNGVVNINLGYADAASEEEALGIAVKTGSKANLNKALINQVVLKVTTPALENYDKAVAALDEIAKLFGLDPDAIELDELMATIRATTPAP